MKSQTIIYIGILFLFIFSISISFPIDKVSYQSDALTNSDATAYYSNQSGYVNKQVNFTGKILSSFLPNENGTSTLQMYQAGYEDRNTRVTHASPIPLLKDACIRVMGITQPPDEYENLFNVTFYEAAINASSVTIIDCSEALDPGIKTVNVGQTQENKSVKITLDKVEFSDKNTRAYLTVENTDPYGDLTFYDFNSRAIQGNS